MTDLKVKINLVTKRQAKDDVQTVREWIVRQFSEPDCPVDISWLIVQEREEEDPDCPACGAIVPTSTDTCPHCHFYFGR